MQDNNLGGLLKRTFLVVGLGVWNTAFCIGNKKYPILSSHGQEYPGAALFTASLANTLLVPAWDNITVTSLLSP